jgi:hypothetical protein
VRTTSLCTLLYLTEPPDAGPHVRWCRRGGVGRPPIPIRADGCDAGRYRGSVLRPSTELALFLKVPKGVATH